MSTCVYMSVLKNTSHINFYDLVLWRWCKCAPGIFFVWIVRNTSTISWVKIGGFSLENLPISRNHRPKFWTTRITFSIFFHINTQEWSQYHHNANKFKTKTNKNTQTLLFLWTSLRLSKRGIVLCAWSLSFTYFFSVFLLRWFFFVIKFYIVFWSFALFSLSHFDQPWFWNTATYQTSFNVLLLFYFH